MDQSYRGLFTARTSSGSGLFEHRFVFQAFLEAIDFSQLQLLHDTATKITLSLTEQGQNPIMTRAGHYNSANLFSIAARQMYCKIAEDSKTISTNI
jgi:hypothetical protein